MPRKPPLRPDQFDRYKRHLALPEFGVEAQQRLLASRVLLIGAGGLGCPLAQYLAAAGVGTLGIVDYDVVDASNLQRQVLYGTRDVGRPKVEVARERILALNPDVKVEAARRAARRPRMRWRSSPTTTWSWTAPTTSRPATSRTTPACCSASRTCTARSSASKARRRSSMRVAVPATAVSIPNRRRPDRCPRAPRAACSACSRASWR